MRIAIVTGGSSGIGKSTSMELARRSIGVILTYRSNKEAAQNVVKEIQETSVSKAVAINLDLTEIDQFSDFEEQVRQNLSRLWGRTTFDYLVNNGGAGGGMSFTEMTEKYFDSTLNTNFKGPFFLTQKLVRLIESGGSIVNVSSGSSHQSHIGYSAFGPSKAALSSWTRYLAKELAPRQIRVNTISPGPVETGFGGGDLAKRSEIFKVLGTQTAFARIGTPQDVANAIVSVLSDDFKWVTAQDIDVSGGFLL